MKFLIEAEKLLDNINDYIIIDTRFELLDPDRGLQLYQESHIPGAVYFDLNKDLSSLPGKHGGNHPLPDDELFTKKLKEAGIDKTSKVVLYDQGNAMFASRLYFLFDYYGHNNIYILNGGFSKWESLGYPVTSVVKRRHKVEESFVKNEAYVVDIEYVKAHKDDYHLSLLDARELERYLGREEPIYHKKGHIPGAKCYDWLQLLNEDGTWKPKDALEKLFKDLNKEDEVILSCGSGVSACMNYLALKSIGFKKVKLYPGSFSDWISYPDLPIETKLE